MNSKCGLLLLVLMAMGCAGSNATQKVGVHPEANNSVWRYATGSGSLRGVCLMVHGLNLNPARMNPLGSALQTAGMDVLQVYLAGHGRPDPDRPDPSARMQTFRTVTLTRWMTQMEAAYQLTRNRARAEGVPLYYVGFSMGGLLGPLLLVSEHSIHWRKMVLLAPAIRLRPRSQLVRALFFFPRLVIPSKSPTRYRANRGTPVAAYHAMFRGISTLNKQMGHSLDLPTMILIDPKDEFVSYRRLQRLVTRPVFRQWRVILVVKDPGVPERTYHHLIIDQNSLGSTAFSGLVKQMVTFLLRDIPAESGAPRDGE